MAKCGGKMEKGAYRNRVARATRRTTTHERDCQAGLMIGVKGKKKDEKKSTALRP